MPTPYEQQEAAAADRRARFGPAARDLAAWLAECPIDSASDYESYVEQWLSDNGGLS